MKKTRVKKSRDTVPLRVVSGPDELGDRINRKKLSVFIFGGSCEI
jgi:hypothetical protein